jgi:hypothetical protein
MTSKKEKLTTTKSKLLYKENLLASVLFTFTSKIEYMLHNGIVPRYVYERLPGTKCHYIAPMKCFCVRTLGKVKNHMERYGYYGIGLKKYFLQEHGTSPCHLKLYKSRN